MPAFVSAGGVTSSLSHALPCPHCDLSVAPVLSMSGPHLRADCARCGLYLKFVPRTQAWLELFAQQEQNRVEAQGSLFGAAS